MRLTTPVVRDDTPPQYQPTIRHRGPCGPRRHCWRVTCRETFGIYPTLEDLPTGEMIAHCHGGSYPSGDRLAQMATA